MNKIIVRELFICLAILVSVTVSSSATPRPVSQPTGVPAPTKIPTHTPTPTPTSEPATNQCCFCVYPSKGERDHDTFKAMCDRCIKSRFNGCKTTAAMAHEDFTPERIKKYNCQGTIEQINLQHGPTGEWATSQVRVCQTAYPTCSINFDDSSCATFQDAEEAWRFVTDIQRALKGPVQVKLCGSRSIHRVSNFACESFRQSVTYNISASNVREELGLCAPTGSFCTVEHDYTYQCLSADKEFIWDQRCCPFKSDIKAKGIQAEDETSQSEDEDSHREGIWGPPGGGCVFEQCDQNSCPTKTYCDGATFIRQVCIEIEDSSGGATTIDKACVKFADDCSRANLQCVQGSYGEPTCGVECDPQTCTSSCNVTWATNQKCSTPSDPSQGRPVCIKKYEELCTAPNWRCMIENKEAVCRPGACTPETCPKRPRCKNPSTGNYFKCANSNKCGSYEIDCDVSKNEECQVVGDEVLCVKKPKA